MHLNFLPESLDLPHLNFLPHLFLLQFINAKEKDYMREILQEIFSQTIIEK
jgi:hypothetical protein